jgi:transcriptional regulator with XRE-family HTH domain
MDTRARIAWNLRQLRSSLGVTQENLAVDAGVDRTVISDLERSKHNASIDLLDRLARALKVDVAIFFISPDPADPRPEPLKPGRKSNK